MLGTLFGLIVLIFGLVLRYDPEARRPVDTRATNERRTDAAAGVVDRVRLHRRHRVLRRRRVPERAPPPPAPAAARVHLGDRDLLDRGAVRLGDVRAVPVGAPADAVVVADEHDLEAGCPSSVPIGYIQYFVLPAVIGAALGNRLSAAVRLAETDRAARRRPGRRLLLGAVLQRVHRRPARRLLLRPRDPGARALRGHQAPVPAVRRARDGRADDGVHLHPRAHGSGRPHGHRHVGRLAGERSSSPVVAAVGVRRRRSSDTSLYGAVFAPHLVTKLRGDVTAGPTEELFPGVPNQPLHGR